MTVLLRLSVKLIWQGLFLLTKIDTLFEDTTNTKTTAKLVRDTVDTEYSILGIDFIDILLLNDSSNSAVMQAQRTKLERLLSDDRVSALGIYNYNRSSIDCILETATVPPSLNYLMRHVGMGPDRTELIQYGEFMGIRTVACGILGEPIGVLELLIDLTVS